MVLNAETNIEKNAYIATRSGHYTLVTQGDGNAVTYFNGLNMTRPAGFQTNTTDGDHLRMQIDGNLALYKSNGTWAWNAGTGNKPYNPGYKLVLYETGRLVILDAANAVVKVLVDIDRGTSEGGAVAYFPFLSLLAVAIYYWADDTPSTKILVKTGRHPLPRRSPRQATLLILP